jgi:hypothetical protein
MSNSVVTAAIIGGLIGGALGVISAALTTYWGPRFLEEWKEKRRVKNWDGPRKALLKRMLLVEKHAIRSLETLSVISGTPKDDCRRLLIELGARGVKIRDKGRGTEGWALISRKPLSDELVDEEQ